MPLGNFPAWIVARKWPICRIEDNQSLLSAIKKCHKITTITSLSCNNDSSLDKVAYAKKVPRLFKQLKYSKFLKIFKDPLETPSNLKTVISRIKRLNTIKGLKLVSSNSFENTRVKCFGTLKVLKHFNKLETVVLHIFFVSNKISLFEKFGKLVQGFRAAKLTIKEPLTLIPEVFIRKFYFKVKETSKQLKVLKLSNYTPFAGSIKQFPPYKFLQKASNLSEVNLNFIGITIKNSFLMYLCQLLKNFRYLSNLSLDLSFNQISDLNSLNELKDISLKKLYLNFGHCPLGENCFPQLAGLISSHPELKSLKLLLSSLKMDEKSLLALIEPLRSLKKLEIITLDLEENRCISSTTFQKIFSQVFTSSLIVKVELNLSRAFFGGLSKGLFGLNNQRRSYIKAFSLDISNNKLRENEIVQIIRILRSHTEIEELCLSIENMRLEGQASETIWEWIFSLKKLKSLEMSLIFSQIAETNLFSLTKGLLKMDLEYLSLNLLETISARSSAETLVLAMLSTKCIKALKINTGLLRQNFVCKFREKLKNHLPFCSRLEIS